MIVVCQAEVSQAQEVLAKVQSKVQQEERGLVDGTPSGVCRGRFESGGSSSDFAWQFRPRIGRIASLSVRVAARELGFAFAVAAWSKWQRTSTQTANKSGKFHSRFGTVEPCTRRPRWSWGRSQLAFDDRRRFSQNRDPNRQCGSKLAFEPIESSVWVIRRARYGLRVDRVGEASNPGPDGESECVAPTQKILLQLCADLELCISTSLREMFPLTSLARAPKVVVLRVRLLSGRVGDV